MRIFQVFEEIIVCKVFAKYRITQHPDKDGYPDHWLIQKICWWQRGWRASEGFFGSNWDAYYHLAENNFRSKANRNLSFKHLQSHQIQTVF